VIVSGFQLVASLASSLVWPLVVVVILIILWRRRAEIANFLRADRPSFEGRTLKRVKAGPVELEWDQLIQSIEERVQAAPINSSTNADRLVSKELASIAGSVPTAAVLEAWARVEFQLSEVLAAKGGYRPSLGILALSDQAYRDGIIKNDLFKAIRNLSRLRNLAAHRVGDADISSADAYEYLELVDRVLGELRQL